MAFNTIIRRSAPLAARLFTTTTQRTFATATRGALRSCLGPCVCKYCYSSASSVEKTTAVKKPSADEALLKVIDSEIQCSVESFEEGEDIPEGFPFKLEDNPGQQTVSLTREYLGETIHVEVEPSSLTTVSKTGGPCLEFGVTAYADEIVIDSLSVKDPDMTEDQLPYEGPRFDELDENLQKAFHKYLEIRGIKPSATNFLHEYMINKEHKEYTNWLKNLKKFVEA
ncbi:glycoprotein family protein [Artemisia annua]|uniref:Glycoprotein family protein n=1 Tax=Artemisia annua TaxID=35608 RepID=A0A2U1QNB5_ARTAN|nr:glycoprotein family protein [Artemisia annua]